MSVKLISITPDAEKIIAYCARVSNPKNQTNHNTASKLLKYCLEHGHVSIFEQAHMTLEIETSIPIAMQLIRHKTFCFQQFSQRYSTVDELGNQFIYYSARRQDNKNRQNSIDDLDQETKDWFELAQKAVSSVALDFYHQALEKGIAKEQARFLLPQNTKTRLYMTGNIRSWIHYLQVRLGNGTQKEHIDIAEKIKDIFCRELPTIAKAAEFIKGENNDNRN